MKSVNENQSLVSKTEGLILVTKRQKTIHWYNGSTLTAETQGMIVIVSRYAYNVTDISLSL